jgi:PST family polysaccharide transporter
LAGASPIADFYHEPRLHGITIALAGVFLFNALGVQHSALLQRQMRFTTLAAIDTTSVIAGFAAGIGQLCTAWDTGPWWE